MSKAGTKQVRAFEVWRLRDGSYGVRHEGESKAIVKFKSQAEAWAECRRLAREKATKAYLLNENGGVAARNDFAPQPKGGR